MVQRREGRCIVQHLSYAGALTLQKYALPFTCPSLFRKSFDRFPEKFRYTPSATEISFTHARALHRSSAFPPSPFTHHGVPHRSPWCLPSVARVLPLSPEVFPSSLGGHLCPPVGHTCPPRPLLFTAFILPDDPFILPTESFIPFPLPYLSQPWCVKGEGGNAKPRCNARARVDAIIKDAITGGQT